MLLTKHMELNLCQNPPVSLSGGDLWKVEGILAACLDAGLQSLLASLAYDSCVLTCCTWHHHAALLAGAP